MGIECGPLDRKVIRDAINLLYRHASINLITHVGLVGGSGTMGKVVVSRTNSSLQYSLINPDRSLYWRIATVDQSGEIWTSLLFAVSPITLSVTFHPD